MAKEDQHEQCQAIKTLQTTVAEMKTGNWKLITLIVGIIMTFGGCTQTAALYYASKSGDKMDHQRTLIDKNKDEIHDSKSRYERLEGIVNLIAENQRESRDEQKKLVEAVHRVEVIVAGGGKTAP